MVQLQRNETKCDRQTDRQTDRQLSYYNIDHYQSFQQIGNKNRYNNSCLLVSYVCIVILLFDY